MARSGPDTSGIQIRAPRNRHSRLPPAPPARGLCRRDCVVSVLIGVPESLSHDERAALEVLADVGLAPRLRLVPVRRQRGSGVA